MPFRALITFLTACTLHLSTAAAASNTTGSAVFVDTSSGNSDQIVFALTAEQDTGDLYIHMSCPSAYSWMGVGIGSQMKDSLIFVAYESKNQTGVTLSPRVATGHNEPSYYDGITCDLVYGDQYTNANTINNSTLTVNAVCHNATQWGTGSFNIGTSGGTTPTSQDFIFALGPQVSRVESAVSSNSKTANLRRHTYYGQFTMDTSQLVVSSNGSVPVPNSGSNTYTLSNASSATNTHSDFDPAPIIHGFVMCLSYVVIFPFGSLVLRMLNRVLAHAALQTLGLILTCMATAGGIVVSTQYNKSKHFHSAHQVIGILLLLALFLQLGLGLLNHGHFKETQQKSLMGKVHLYLGPAIILVGIINAPIGFVFAGNPHLCLPYTIILVLFILIYCAIRFLSKHCCGSRSQRRKATTNVFQDGSMPGVEGYRQPPHFGAGAEQVQRNGGAAGYGYAGTAVPPPYARGDSYQSQQQHQQNFGGYYGQAEHDVPLTTYESRGSGLGGRAVQERTMI